MQTVRWSDEATTDVVEIINCIVVYRVGAETIDVLRVLHSRRQYP